jgi:hypothetical protein
MDSLVGRVMTTSGKECLMEFENMMRLLARIAILNEPWLQNAEEVLTAMIVVCQYLRNLVVLKTMKI